MPLPLAGEVGRRASVGRVRVETLPDSVVQLARRLRRDQTDAERLLWGVLRNRNFGGFKFRRQKPFPPYVVDFYCAQGRLAVELDGGQHAETDVAERDKTRSEFLASHGVRVLRFWNHEVLGDLEGVLGALWLALKGSDAEL